MEHKPEFSYKDYHFYIMEHQHIIKYKNVIDFVSDDLKESFNRWDEIIGIYTEYSGGEI